MPAIRAAHGRVFGPGGCCDSGRRRLARISHRVGEDAPEPVENGDSWRDWYCRGLARAKSAQVCVHVMDASPVIGCGKTANRTSSKTPIHRATGGTVIGESWILVRAKRERDSGTH